MVPDDDPEWKRKLAYHFEGVWVTHGGRYLRPYAIVVSWGPEDMRVREEITPDSDSFKGKSHSTTMKGEFAGRSLFYANDPKRDVLKNLRINKLLHLETKIEGVAVDREGCVSVLFEELRNFPFQLVSAHSDAQKAFDALIKAAPQLLELRGYSYSFPPADFKVRYDSRTIQDPAPEDVSTSYENDSAETRRDWNRIGRHRCQVIDAEKNGVPLDVWQGYEAQMNGADSPEIVEFERRLQAMNKAFEVQRTMDLNLPRWKVEIIERAGDQWIEGLRPNGEVMRFPRAPFEQWCLWRTDGAHLALPWEPVAPSGLKMYGDDPYHSDFLIGGGYSVTSMLDDKQFQDDVFALRHQVQEEKLGFECAVLSGRSYVRGTVCHPSIGDTLPDDAIVVLRAADPDFVDLALKARAVIVERGGAMAHLVTVAREREAVIVRVPGALKLYPVGSSVTVDAERGKVTLHEGDMKLIWDQV
jgi:phosphohistidine swiveling domain-containing protein